MLLDRGIPLPAPKSIWPTNYELMMQAATIFGLSLRTENLAQANDAALWQRRLSGALPLSPNCTRSDRTVYIDELLIHHPQSRGDLNWRRRHLDA